MNEVEFGLLLLALCGAGLLLCASLVVFEKNEKRVPAATIDWPPTWAEIQETLAVNDPKLVARFSEKRKTSPVVVPFSEKRPTRHNIHCVRCGRFAKRVSWYPGAGQCKHHGITIKVDLSFGSSESKLILSGHTNQGVLNVQDHLRQQQ